jgi:hypothetical protein
MLIWKWLFADKSGKMVYGQMPNLPLIVWGVASLLSIVPWFASLHTVFETIAFGSLFTWAWLEIFDGANWFRRLLGVAVMSFLLFGV